MKRLLSLGLTGLLALGLTACGESAAAPSVPQATQTPETAPAEAAPASAAFFALGSGDTADFNTGDACYSLQAYLGYVLIMKTDYATATRQVLCSVPGCTHDSEACPAWLPGRGQSVQLFAVGDTVYAYHGVPTMRYQGSWEDYYAEIVEPHLAQPSEALAGMTEEEILTFYRNRYAEASAPAGLYVIEGDGASRRNIQASQDLTNVTVGWCDGTALYGYALSEPAVSNSTGYRISLADGAVTTFALQQQEQILGAQGHNLLTSRTVTAAPLPDYNDEGWDAYDAVLHTATVEYDWLDPATGARTKVLETPHDRTNFGTEAFHGLCNGKLYFDDATPLEEGGSQRDALCVLDAATGEWQDLLRPIPDPSMHMPRVTVAGLPDIAAQQGRYLWITGSDNVNGENRAWVLDTQTGTLTAVEQTMEEFMLPNYAVQLMAQTDDGRFLLETGEGEDGPRYALMAIDAFLQGSTDYTPVAAS